MLKLDYSLSLSWNEPDASSLEDANELVLRYDCFLGDVIFLVSEIDMSARWGWVPVLDFALGLDAVVKALAPGEDNEAVFEFTESDATIRLRRVGEAVEIEASYAPGSARVRYDDLRAIAKRFLARVVQDLLWQRPELHRNIFIEELLDSMTIG